MKRMFFYVAVIFLTSLLGLIIFFPILGWGTGLEQNVDEILLSSSSDHIFGTDSLGRDLFTRVLLGGRVSLLVGLFCSALSLIFGVTVGAVAGWNEGWVDRALMRICDIMMALPSFIFVAVLVMSLQLLLPIEDVFYKSLVSLCLGIFSTHWMSMARVSRAMVLEIRHKPFVEAAEVLGGSRAHIMVRHILPNMLGTVLVMAAMQVPNNILYESFMSFIGLGIQPPYTSWGILVREGWKTLSSFPHLILYPSMILFLMVWSVHVILDYLKLKLRL